MGSDVTASDPKLSVIVPAYNAQDTLPAQLDALAAQNVDFPFEVLVCDNGSSDDTAALVREYRGNIIGLRLIDASARRGPAAARNIGARNARSPLLAFCDADDVVGLGWVASMRAALIADEFVAGAREWARLNDPSQPSVVWDPADIYQMPYMPLLTSTGTNNMGIRKDVFDEAGGFDEALRTSEDTDLAWRVQLAGHPLSYHPEVVVHVRKRVGYQEIARQAYRWGVGDEVLRRRYRKVIGAVRAQTAKIGRPDGSGRGGALPKALIRTSSAAKKLAHELWMLIWSPPSGIFIFTHRFGVWNARIRRVRVDELPPPAELPALFFSD